MSPTSLRHTIAVNVSELGQIAPLLRAFGTVCLLGCFLFLFLFFGVSFIARGAPTFFWSLFVTQVKAPPAPPPQVSRSLAFGLRVLVFCPESS